MHKEPASAIPRNAIFDGYVARPCVWSEHTMGALKGRLQCLCGLWLPMNSKMIMLQPAVGLLLQ